MTPPVQVRKGAERSVAPADYLSIDSDFSEHLNLDLRFVNQRGRARFELVLVI